MPTPDQMDESTFVSLPPREVKFLHEDERIDPGRLIFHNTVAAENGPTFSPSEAAKLFGISPQWLRRMESRGVFELPRPEGAWRRYNLADIESISYAMADHNLLDYDRHKAILNVVLNLARIWKIA